MSESKPFLVAEAECPIGDVYLDGPSPLHPHFHGVFEDNGQTGSFYAYDLRIEEQPIVDAIHVYNNENITDGAKPSLFQIIWSRDGLKTALFINDYPHAVFDFESKRGYCRTNVCFPTPGFTNHEWTDECLRWFV